jgi:hypothetical protein
MEIIDKGRDDDTALVERRVVSSFVFYTPEGGVEKVALFRRSDKVHTYQ